MINLKNVKINDKFWSKKIELVSKEVIPYQWDALNDNIPGAEPSHAINNFRIAAGLTDDKFYGFVFQDSDVGKWLEAVSYSLIVYPDPILEKTIDDLIDLISKAQQPDGYLNTYFTIAKPEERWKDMAWGHELYSAGHLIEGAVAYFESTGKRRFLDIMCKYADYIDEVFGPEKNKMQKYCGHEEIELALVKLYKVTENNKYLNLSKFFIDERGKQPCFFNDESSYSNANHGDVNRTKWFGLDYHQAHSPVREQLKAEGHSVRAMYLYTAMADLVIETGDKTLLNSLNKLWDNVTNYKMYITGGLGSQGYAERFTFDYDLPNDTSYTETCASIGFIFWAYRMLLIDPDNKYSDAMERAFYNGALSGISLDGKRYFYVNPLEVYPEAVEKRYDHTHVKPERQQWYGCACCPPNIARLITSLGQYIYSNDNDTLYVHLYMNNNLIYNHEDNNILIIQTTNYPWDGNIKINIIPDTKKEFTLALRVPGWCRNYSLFINGQKIDNLVIEKGYIKIKKIWNKDDIVELNFEMKIDLIQSNPKVRENIGKVAIQRGPVIYCIEEVDNGKNLKEIFLNNNSKLEASFDNELFGGIIVIKGEAERIDDSSWDNLLYKCEDIKTKNTKISAIPYSMWCNRKPGEMLVWINKK
jgi:DUF1680 family protein